MNNLTDLAREAAACPRWKWMAGMLTHTTHKGGFPSCPAGTPLRIESLAELEDAVTEGMFGLITEEPGHAHPRFEELLELHEQDRQATWARVLPDLTDPATIGCLEALVEEAWNCDAYRRVGIEPAGAGWCVIVRNGRHRPPSKARPSWDLDKVAHPPYRNVPSPFGDNEFPSRAAALVAALKAAPCA